MASIDTRPLKAFVRFDGTGRIVPSSLILRRKKPKVGKWVEIPAYECCNPTTTTTTTVPVTTTTTTTTAAFYEFTVSFAEDGPTACAGLPGTTTVYAASNTIGINTFLYTDSALTTPVDNGYYAYAGMVYLVPLANGQILSESSC